jgi:hypothetical protein
MFGRLDCLHTSKALSTWQNGPLENVLDYIFDLSRMGSAAVEHC